MDRTSKLLNQLWKPLKTSIRHKPYPLHFTHFLENQMPKPKYSKLQNGLTIATEERENCPIACIGVFIDAGSRYENDFEAGVAHFFEHIAFKGTKNRDKSRLYCEMNCMGATFRSYTTREMVAYYVLCQTPHVPVALDLLSDCVFCNALSNSEIEEQKKVAYAEMLEEDKDVNKLLNDYLHAAAFQGTTLGRSVEGPSHNLHNLNAATIYGYLAKYFCPARTVLAAVGGIKHEQIECLASCYLNNVVANQAVDADIYRYTGSEIRYRDDSMPAGNVMMAVEGPCWCDEDNIIMEIARYAVGGWDRSQISGKFLASRLGRHATSGAPICHAYKSFNINYKDTGLWGAQFLCDALDLDDMSICIQDDWMYLCNLITEAEVQRAKRFYKAKFLSDLQTCDTNCYDLGRWTLYNGCRPSLVDKIAAVDRVTAKDVREVSTRYLYNKCPTVAAVGRVEGLMEYNRLRNSMYWLRI